MGNHLSGCFGLKARAGAPDANASKTPQNDKSGATSYLSDLNELGTNEAPPDAPPASSQLTDLSRGVSEMQKAYQAPEEVKPTGPSLDLNNMQPGQAQMPVATCTASGESNLYPMLGLQTSTQADSKTGRNDRKAKTGKQAASSQEPAAATATAQAAAAAAAAVQAAAAAAADSFLSDKGLIIKTHSPSAPLG